MSSLPPDTTAIINDSSRAAAAPRPGSLIVRGLRGTFGTGISAIFGAVVVVVVVLIAILAPVLTPYGLDEQSRDAFAGISASHPLGTDEVGRDLMTRLLYAIRLDLVIALVAIPIGAVVGVLLGLSGIISPWIGQATARVFDIIIGFPTLILGIAIAMVIAPGFESVVVAIALINVPVFGRLARGGMLSQLGRDYIVAARSLGASRWRILVRHVLPNISAPILVQAAVAIADSVFIEGGLSILGVGIQPPSASLGSMLQSGLTYISISPAYVLAPTIVLALIVLGFASIADRANAST